MTKCEAASRIYRLGVAREGDPRPCPCQACGKRVYRAMAGWTKTRSPLRVIGYKTNIREHPVWAEHVYREKTDAGTWRFIAQPYSIDQRAREDIHELREMGWKVAVTGPGFARHNSACYLITIEAPA